MLVVGSRGGGGGCCRSRVVSVRACSRWLRSNASRRAVRDEVKREARAVTGSEFAVSESPGLSHAGSMLMTCRSKGVHCAPDWARPQRGGEECRRIRDRETEHDLEMVDGRRRDPDLLRPAAG